MTKKEQDKLFRLRNYIGIEYQLENISSIDDYKYKIIEYLILLDENAIDKIFFKKNSINSTRFDLKKLAELTAIPYETLFNWTKKPDNWKYKFLLHLVNNSDIHNLFIFNQNFDLDKLYTTIYIEDISIKKSIYFEDINKIVRFRKLNYSYQKIVDNIGYGTKQSLSLFLKKISIE